MKKSVPGRSQCGRPRPKWQGQLGSEDKQGWPWPGGGTHFTEAGVVRVMVQRAELPHLQAVSRSPTCPGRVPASAQ